MYFVTSDPYAHEYAAAQRARQQQQQQQQHAHPAAYHPYTMQFHAPPPPAYHHPYHAHPYAPPPTPHYGYNPHARQVTRGAPRRALWDDDVGVLEDLVSELFGGRRENPNVLRTTLDVQPRRSAAAQEKPRQSLQQQLQLHPSHLQPQQPLQMSCDLVENAVAYTVRADLPGVAAEDIEVHVVNRDNDRLLVLKAQRKQQYNNTSNPEVAGGVSTVHFSESSYGMAQRCFRLPEEAQSDAIQCQLNQGVLTVTIPKAAGPTEAPAEPATESTASAAAAADGEELKRLRSVEVEDVEEKDE